MTIRDHLKYRYRLMIWGVMMTPVLGLLWLHSSTPLNHTFRSSTIAIVEIAVMLLFLATFRCSNCHKNLSAVSRQLLFNPRFCSCPHCGINLDQSTLGRVGL
jgi:hypothetical protein